MKLKNENQNKEISEILASAIYTDVDIDEIRKNPMNKAYFTENQKETHKSLGKERDSSYKELLDSIKAIGITTPLLLTKDYRILSGHRRYLCALALNIQKLNCIILKHDISEDYEKIILIDSNITRSINSSKLKVLKENRIDLYKKLIPGFAARIIEKNKDVKITAKELAKKTGFSEATVSRDLSCIRRDETRKENEAIAKINGVDTSAVNKIDMNLKVVQNQYSKASIKTRKQMMKKIDDFYKKLQKL